MGGRVSTLEKQVVVLGAGIAGLLAARELKSRGCFPIVIEKSRGVGGRMATRRINGAVFDHGAQSLTVTSEEFGSMVSRWRESGVVRHWYGKAHAARDSGPVAVQTFYCCPSGMSGIAKHLAEGLEVRLQSRVRNVALAGNGWRLEIENQSPIDAIAVIATCPLPQALALWRPGEIPGLASIAKEISYEKRIVVLMVLEQALRLAVPGRIEQPAEGIEQLVDNAAKGISPNASSATVTFDAPSSLELWGEPDDKVEEVCLKALRSRLAQNPVTTQVHRWHYSQAVSKYHDRYFLNTDTAPLALAGDGFAGNGIEGAALSGIAAARALAEALG